MAGLGFARWLLGVDEAWSRRPATAPEAISQSSGRKTYERVVTLVPSVTEVVFALGQGDRVVGVSEWVSWPPEAAEKPSVGGYSDVSFEQLTKLQPDLVIIEGKHEEVRDYASRRGVALLGVRMANIASIFEGIRAIASALGCPEQGEVLCADIALDLAKAKALAAGGEVPSVLVTVSRRSGELGAIMSAGPDTFLGEAVELGGGRNIFEDAWQRWPTVSKEVIVHRGPEIIIEFCAGETLSQEQVDQRVADWRALPSLPAVRKGRIYTITESYAELPGPRVGKLALRIAGVLHGEEDDS